MILKLRHSFYDRGWIKHNDSPVPTVCIGNVTVGGTGKTPHTEMILDMLQKSEEFSGKNIAVLSRGYKRKTKGFQQVVADGSANDYGDEPLQIKKKFPGVTVAVDKNRVAALECLADPAKLDTYKAARKCKVREFPSADLVLLDDAYQYRKLKATLNIVLVDFSRPVFEDKLLPYGSLRDLAERIALADIIIVTKCTDDMYPEEKEQWAQNLRIKDFDRSSCTGISSRGKKQYLFFSKVQYCHPVPMYKECDARYQYSKRAILFSGIADDSPLMQYLSDTYKIKRHIKFPDHHKFTSADMSRIEAAISDCPTAAVVTTEKDAQRVLDNPKVPVSLKERLFQMPIRVKFLSERENSAFRKAVLDAIRS